MAHWAMLPTGLSFQSRVLAVATTGEMSRKKPDAWARLHFTILARILPRGTKNVLTNPQTIWKLDERFLWIIIHLAFDWATYLGTSCFPNLPLHTSKLGGHGFGTSPNNSKPQFRVLYFHHHPNLGGCGGTRTPKLRSACLSQFNHTPMSWSRGSDLNQRPLGYEPSELPDCSTPQ